MVDNGEQRQGLDSSPMATRSLLRNLRPTHNSFTSSFTRHSQLGLLSRSYAATLSQLSRPSQLPHTRTMATQVDDRFLADAKPPVCSLNIKDAFAALTKEESKYRIRRLLAGEAGPVGDDRLRRGRQAGSNRTVRPGG